MRAGRVRGCLQRGGSGRWCEGAGRRWVRAGARGAQIPRRRWWSAVPTKSFKLNPGSRTLVPSSHATAPCAPAPRLNPAWRPVRRSRQLRVGPRRPGAGPSPAPAPAPRSARRAAPLLCQLRAPGQPGRDRAPQCPAPGASALERDAPAGGCLPGSRG